MDKFLKKRGFPWGILLLLFILLSLLSLCASAGYLWYAGRSRLNETERSIRQYSTAVIEALANVAELGYETGNYTRLTGLLREKIGFDGGIEAFFILPDGRIKAHSSSTIEKELQGNVANDEFAYNLDQILLPLSGKKREVHFLDYNIINERVPFGREEKILIKKLLYPGISSTGWLATRAIFSKQKAVGTLNFIISKHRVFQALQKVFRESLAALAVLQAASLFISLFVALMVHLRYRRPGPEAEMFPALTMDLTRAVQYGGGAKPRSSTRLPRGDAHPDAHRAIRDAIPIVK